MKAALLTIAAAVASCMFSGVRATYSQDDALSMVYLAGAAYCNASSLYNWNCGQACNGPLQAVPGTITVIEDSSLELQVYVAQMTDGRNLVSFRGTVPSDLMDWIDDIKSAVHVPYQGPGCDGCTVADGFYNSYLSLAPQVKSALNNLGGGTTVVTGHSLGAAIAGLAIFDLYNSGFSVAGPHYTFGQPRDGDATYASTYASLLGQDTIYRVVHNADVVPHLPTESMGFHHTAREIWYNEASSSYSVCDGSGEDPSCSDSLLLPISVSDHLHYLNLPISGMCN